MKQKYDPKSIEPKWQQYWEEQKTFEVTEDKTKEKFYSLIEFPYPSGAGLHVGHPRPFTAMDVVSRKKRMDGYNVLYPIGFDAFGLPTENYAIKTGRPPAEVTAENIANFTRQLKMLGYSFDWSRAVDTTDPEYYKWTQWLFLQFYKHGLAYKKNMPINWCINCKIGLANEEVVDGKCERCGGPVEKRDKEQWMLAITKYADSLLEGLKDVDYIPQARTQQENWIGRSEGAEITFAVTCHPELVSGSVGENDETLLGKMLKQVQHDKITVFTTRPDTLFGATYMVLAPEHPLISNFKFQISNFDEVEAYIKKATLKSDLERTELQKEKTGVELKGVKAINPATKEEIPVFVADYVLASYGTGAIMAVPAHDERDFEFAQKYALDVKQVVAPYYEPIDDMKFQVGKETLERRCIDAIIEHPEGNKFLLQKDTHVHFVGGGTDGEELQVALEREILEETGFKNYEVITKVVDHIYSKTYRATKDKNQIVDATYYHVKLKDLEQVPSEIEEGQHTVEWVEKEKIGEKIEWPHHKIAWDIFLGEAYSGDGKLCNSGEFDGLKVEEAKEKIITWLEENGVGKRKVQFKLRDWVFSRQRYWGEPIPLVHCDACENKKYKYVLLHGFTGSSKDNFFPWLKNALEEKGHTVYCPDLPNTDKPSIQEQTQFVLDNTTFDKDTIIVAHSLGSIVTYKLLEQIDNNVHKVVLVDGFLRPEFNDGERPYVQQSAGWQFDFETIKNKAKEFVVLADNKFPTIPEDQSREMASLFDTTVSFRKAQAEHFCALEEPEVLEASIEHGWIPLPEDQLPLTLPEVEKYEPTDTGESPLAAMSDWVNTTCPACGGPARRETDTMPNWAGSSWYFLRYTDPKNTEAFASKEALDYWMPIDWYNGGMEHTVLHLLYSRFWNQFLYDIGLVPSKEPYAKRTSHGMILASDGEKMSKSRGNVINPDDMVEKFGTDAFRTYIMFMGPFDQAVSWDTDGLKGVRRFLDRAWNLKDRLVDDSEVGNLKLETGELDKETHKTIKKVGEDIENMAFNTAVAKLMELVNVFYKYEKVPVTNYQLLVTLLSPFAPHIAEELWQELGHDISIAYEEWPTYNESKLVEDEITLAVQVNGKVRATITVAADIEETDVKTLALEQENVIKWLDGKEPKKVIYVKGRLVSVVV